MKQFLFITLAMLGLTACDVTPQQYEGTIDIANNPLPLSDGSGVCASDLAWFEDNVLNPVITPSCISCHREGDLASTTQLVFDLNDPSASFNRLLAFSQTSENAVNLLAKPSGEEVHGGGQNIEKNSSEYQQLQQWLDRLDSFGDCDAAIAKANKEFWQGVSLLSEQDTLRKAAILYAGRLPSEQEINAINSDSSQLAATIRGLMQGANFEAFIQEGANDNFLTNKWNNDQTPAVDLLGPGGRFPHFWDRLGVLQDAINNAANDEERQAAREAFGIAWRGTQIGLSLSPLQLVSKVVSEERPYSEVLTADYIMVNPYSNISYNTGLSFTDNDDENEWKSARITSAGYANGDIPHAGVLTDVMWLARYPSTDTNRNRARARWAYYFFLGVDIEGSAVRPTNANALMDTDNPTLNNPNCTVCHTVMDPVAGAFQNFGDDGHFRDAWSGQDALPQSYKQGDLYQPGDLWYRDMLAPGFAGTVMASAQNETSLPWLAQQMVQDDRFAIGTVKFWWPVVMGEKTLNLPTEVDDHDYQEKLAAFTAQQNIISELASTFRNGSAGTAENGALNLKDLLVDLALSPAFRANALNSDIDTTPNEQSDTDRNLELATMGIGRLTTPEQLNRKISALSGKTWSHPWDDNTQQLLRDFYGLFGGIDSDTVSVRTPDLNTLMASVSVRMANELPCRVVIDEFEKDIDQRLLFRFVEIPDTPTKSEEKVKQQVNALLERIWADKVVADLAEEQEQAYNLFEEVWRSRVESEAKTWLYQNDINADNDDDDEFCRLDWDNEQALRDDDQHTVRSWMALLTYLFSDFAVIYE